MRKPSEQPSVQYLVRDAWDTGEEDHLVATAEEARKLKAEFIASITKSVNLSESQAAKYVTVHLVVRLDDF